MTLYALACIGLQAVPDGSGPTGATVGDVSLSQAAVDFGSVALGSQGVQAITLSNGGVRPIHILAEVTGEGFSVDRTEFSLVKAGEEAITLEFAPNAAGNFDGELLLTIGDDPLVVPLVGVGVAEGDGRGTGDPAGQITTDQPSLSFGNLDLYASSMMVVTVSNTGDAPLTVNSATSSDSVFALGGNLTPPRTLDPGESRVVEVTFTPTNERTYADELILTSDDPDAPRAEIPMTGKGTNECDVCGPLITVDTGGSSDYAITDFNTLFGADTRTVTIGNDGDQDLDISQVDVNNDFLQPCGTFSIGGGRATSVAPGRTTSFTITYKTTDTCIDVPQKALDANVVHITSNDPAEPDYVIEVGGIGF